MPAGNPERRAEARRLVEAEGVSLREAAARVGSDERTVRRWQTADESRGDGWLFRGSAAEAKARADAVPAEVRAERTAHATRASRARWADRRSEEADYFGTLTGGIRVTAAEAITAARTSIAARDADATVKWARALRDFAVTGGIFGDKADKFSDIASAPSIVAIGSDETYQNDLAEVLSLVERIDEERRAG